MTDNKMERYKVKKAIKDLVKNINETTHIPAITEDDIFELFQLDSIADLRKVSRNFLKLSKILDHFSTATEIATSEKEGIVKFGIENGNAVDVKDWIKGIGGVIGGYVSKVSNKEAGKWYLNDLTDGKIYKCIQNHTSTSFDTTKYLDISNYGLSDKLENLYTVSETVEVPNSVFSAVKFWRYGNRAFLFVFFDYKNSREVNWMTEGIPLTNYPANFTPDTPFLNTEHVILSNNNLNKNIARLVLRNDKITIHGVEGMTHYELKGIISYMTK